MISLLAERDAVNINFLLPLIRKAELSRSEVQLLTDMLLTKHLDQVSDHFEWTEVSLASFIRINVNNFCTLYVALL